MCFGAENNSCEGLEKKNNNKATGVMSICIKIFTTAIWEDFLGQDGLVIWWDHRKVLIIPTTTTVGRRSLRLAMVLMETYASGLRDKVTLFQCYIWILCTTRSTNHAILHDYTTY